jgi:hypothetical protein
VFPLIDLVLGFSHLPTQFSILTFFKQIVAQFGGWYFVQSIPATGISSANILFSHVSQSNFVANIFSSFRWPVVLISILVAGAIFYAYYHLIKKENNKMIQLLGIIFLGIVGGYSIGWYILTGDRVFVRRLDSVFAFLLVFFTIYGLSNFQISRFVSTISTAKKYIYFFVILTFLSFCATIIYATGPNVRVVSHDEYESAQYIYDREKTNLQPCVLSDTWLLLALEGVSRGAIVGGGFPMSNNFGQVERVKLYKEILKNPDVRILSQISSVMPVSSCYVAVSRDEIDPRTEQRLHDLLGHLVFKSGSVLVWKMDLKKL